MASHTERIVTQGMSQFKSAPADGNPDMQFLIFPQLHQANTNSSSASRQATTTSFHIRSIHYWLITLPLEGAKYDVWKSVVGKSNIAFVSALFVDVT